jgi:tRNA dimethylallyltransferase
MQVYKEMDIATAKITKKERQGIKHHLIDIINPQQDYNAAIFREEALKLIGKIHEDDMTPLIVGGSCLYIQILIDGIFKDNKKTDSLRTELKKNIEEKGAESLYKYLMNVDPASAKKIHPNDKKRLIRALEVFHLTEKPLSELKNKRHPLSDKYKVIVYGLSLPRPLLYKRINERVDSMFKRGLVDEARNLYDNYKLSKTAKGAVGYKELFGYFKKNYDLQEAKRLIKRNTRRYAKRQMTWFKKESKIKWQEVKENDLPSCIAQRIYNDVKCKL